MLALVADIAARGIDEPLLVVKSDEDGSEIPGSYFLADGRHRLRAAILAGLSEVPVIVREDHEVADIVLSTLIHRRHFMEKGILAYVAYPAVASKLKGPGGARSGSGGINQHNRGSKLHRATLILPESDREETGGKGSKEPVLPTMDDIAHSLGISRDTLMRARQIHLDFRRNPDLREQFEPRILSGDLPLNRYSSAAHSSESTRGGSRNAPRYLVCRSDGGTKGLLPKSLITLGNGFERWGEFDPEARAVFRDQFLTLIASAPEEILIGLKKGLRP